MDMPLSIMLENAKSMFISAFNQVSEQTKLPAYLIEGIMLGILSDIRAQKNIELTADYKRVSQDDEGE